MIDFETILGNVRTKAPLVHNITNYVTVNDCANILLACGGSPIMSDDEGDVEDITAICAGLNINIGTLNKNTIPSMFLAGKKASELGHITLLDPVGAGASRLRTETAAKLIDRDGFAFSGMDQFRGWESILGLQFENLVVNHFQELLPHLHLENSLVYSAAPYRNGGRKGEGVQIDLLLQTKRSAYVVEVKRCAEIGQEVVDDVARKVRRLKVAPGNSIRSALVYDGHLSRTVEADGFFDAIIPFRRLLGI